MLTGGRKGGKGGGECDCPHFKHSKLRPREWWAGSQWKLLCAPRLVQITVADLESEPSPLVKYQPHIPSSLHADPLSHEP